MALPATPRINPAILRQQFMRLPGIQPRQYHQHRRFAVVVTALQRGLRFSPGASARFPSLSRFAAQTIWCWLPPDPRAGCCRRAHLTASPVVTILRIIFAQSPLWHWRIPPPRHAPVQAQSPYSLTVPPRFAHHLSSPRPVIPATMHVAYFIPTVFFR